MELHGTFPWKMSMQKFPWNSMEIGVLMFSLEFHGKCPNPPWKMSMQKFPWNSMEIGALMFSMQFHRKCPNPPCKYFLWKSMEKFPWNSMEIDVLILHGKFSMEFHGIPWRFFTREAKMKRVLVRRWQSSLCFTSLFLGLAGFTADH